MMEAYPILSQSVLIIPVIVNTISLAAAIYMANPMYFRPGGLDMIGLGIASIAASLLLTLGNTHFPTFFVVIPSFALGVVGIFTAIQGRAPAWLSGLSKRRWYIKIPAAVATTVVSMILSGLILSLLVPQIALLK